MLGTGDRCLWMLNHYAITPDMAGGTRHFDLARELVQIGYDVTIIASSFNHAERREKRLTAGENWQLENVDGVKFVWVRSYAYHRNDWRRLVNIVAYMHRAYWLGRQLVGLECGVSRPDVVLGSSVHLLAVLSGYYLSRHYGAHFMMEVRDLWPQTLVDMGILGEHNPTVFLLRRLERFLYRRAERIVTLSPLTEEYLARAGVSTEKVVYIPNGTSVTRFAESRDGELAQDGFTLVYAGSHATGKSLDTALGAADILARRGYPDIQFVFVGDGPEKPRLMALAQQLRLPNVRFEDPVPRSEVPALLGAADGLLLSESRVLYGSSNKLFDYMASGKPIVSAVFARHNTVEDAQCGLSIPPGDSDALAEAAVRLRNMPAEQRTAMGARGRDYVCRHHDYRVLAERLHRCIESLEEGDE